MRTLPALGASGLVHPFASFFQESSLGEGRALGFIQDGSEVGEILFGTEPSKHPYIGDPPGKIGSKYFRVRSGPVS